MSSKKKGQRQLLQGFVPTLSLGTRQKATDKTLNSNEEGQIRKSLRPLCIFAALPDPSLRLQFTLVLVIGTAFLKTGAWSCVGIYGAIALLWALFLKTSWLALSKILGAELIFLSLLALPLGFERASFLLVRSLVCLVATNSCLLSMPPSAISMALKGLPLPSGIKETALLASNYITILAAEVSRMQRAAQCRGLSGPAAWMRYASAALIGALYLRSLARSERVYDAMVARGYSGYIPVDVPMNSKARYSLWLAILIAGTLTLVSYWF